MLAHLFQLARDGRLLLYFKDTLGNMESELKPIQDLIVQMKDNDGNCYIPSFNINDINLMRPTQGYLLKALGDATLIYSE